MRRAIPHIVILFALSCFSQSAFAQRRSLEEGPVVRRQLLYRSDRIELEPAIGHTMNDPYRRTLYLHLGTNYHLTNDFSVGLNLAFGAIHYNSNLLDGVEAANPSVARRLGFAETTLQTDFHLAYVPFYGKFHILEEATVNYDFHVMLGVGGALQSADEPALEGFKFGPALGFGFRFFLDGDTAVTFDVIDHMFSAADVQREAQLAEESFSHSVMIAIGVSFFVTGELRVSR
jgi:outer membrane beta-barrel protein